MMTGIARHDRSLLLGLGLNFVLFGASMTIFGAAAPEVRAEYGWSNTDAGIVFAASAAGYALSTFVCGLLLNSLGARQIIVATLVIESLCFALFARSSSVALNTALNFAIGLGQGGTEIVTNFAAIRIERDGRSRLMNLLHAAFSVGGILGPVGVAGVLQSSVGWRFVFPAMGATLLAMAAGFALLRFDSVRRDQATAPEGPDNPAAGAPWLLALYSLTILLYVGVELSVSNWSPGLFVEMGASPAQGASVVAMLWAGLLCGRLGISLLYKGERQEIPLLALAVASAACLFLLLLSPSMGAGMIITALIGLGLSAIYPLVMSLVGKTFHSPAAVGIVGMAGGAGSLAFPVVIGALADAFGLRAGFVLCLAVAIVLVACAAGVCLSAEARFPAIARGRFALSSRRAATTTARGSPACGVTIDAPPPRRIASPHDAQAGF
jgi:fucose permease